MKFDDLENEIKKYMLLEDEGIVRLLAAFIVGNKLPLPPPWLFIVSSSSGGKTKLIQLLESIPGYFDVDDLTGNTLLSGARNHEKSNSLLHKMDAEEGEPFLVFRDFTTILSKNKEVMQQLMGQLRMVYDGKFVKHTGMGDEISYNPKKAPGLLAGVTTKIYTTSREWSEMGERMVMYHMKQPNNRQLGRWILDDHQDKKGQEDMLRAMFAKYVHSIAVPEKPSDLPPMDDSTKNDLVEIAYLAVVSRSPVERSNWKEEIVLRHDQEMIGRMLKQLQTLAYAMMLMNDDRQLHPRDKAILYKIALDSIPVQRLMVMRTLTESSLGGDYNQIADALGYPYETTERWVQDLHALGILYYETHFVGSRNKKIWKIKPEFMDIISKFEHINPKEEELPPSEEESGDLNSLVQSAGL